MKSKVSVAAIVALWCCLPAAAADDDGITKGFGECMEKAASVTVDMLDCIDAETKVQDTRLNKAYSGLMGQLSAERKKQLQEAQRAWIKYRDSNCSFYMDPDGGSIATLNNQNCILNSTASRAQELEDMSG